MLAARGRTRPLTPPRGARAGRNLTVLTGRRHDGEVAPGWSPATSLLSGAAAATVADPVRGATYSSLLSGAASAEAGTSGG
ncbi:hypothetical protein ACFPM0_20195 [Pseudonocardia sulfidoxydans]|uniref:hypothetical protein n=1 Tax=Pseudonocardia sulfidoxydans TaxID=54011 RepID=UPI0036204478